MSMGLLPDEVCSDTDKVGLPAWCVDVPDLTLLFFAQCFLEIGILLILAWLTHRYAKWARLRKARKRGKKGRKEPQSWSPYGSDKQN